MGACRGRQLESRLRAFFDDFNLTLAHPFAWT